MQVIQIFDRNNEHFLWVRKVSVSYEIVEGFNVVRSQWEIVENLFDVTPITCHDTLNGAREFAYFYLTGETKTDEVLWEYVNA